jgi:hypothetical protein
VRGLEVGIPNSRGTILHLGGDSELALSSLNLRFSTSTIHNEQGQTSKTRLLISGH